LYWYSGVLSNLLEDVGYRAKVFELAADEFRSVWQVRQAGLAPYQALGLSGPLHYGYRKLPAARSDGGC
jgi:hypothetical protein